jgi:hypothetical protein
MKMEEDRGDLNTAASQHHQGMSNLEGKRNVVPKAATVYLGCSSIILMNATTPTPHT